MNKQKNWVKQCWDFHSCRISELDVAVDWADFEHEGNRCWCCGHSTRSLQKCHIVPRALGGSSQYSNIIPLCAQCHDRAPDTDDYFAMFEWIKSEQNPLSGLGAGRAYAYYELTLSELRTAQIDLSMLHVPKFVRYLKEAFDSASLHFNQSGAGSTFSEGTRKWAIRNAIRRYRCDTNQ